MTRPARKTWVEKTFGWFCAPSVNISMDSYYGMYKPLPEPSRFSVTRTVTETPAVAGPGRITVAAGTAPSPAD